jgi:hypothetical protein
VNNQIAQTICQAFDQNQYYSKCLNTARANAQAMLSGRTHYVDDSTLRYFNSRITGAQPSCFGLFFVITESVGKDSRNGARGFRTVLFDINGKVVYRPDLEQLESTSTKAQKAFYEWYDIFNEHSYYQEELKGKIIKTNRQANDLEKCLNALNEVATA